MEVAREFAGIALIILGIVLIVIGIIRMGGTDPSIASADLPGIIGQLIEKSPYFGLGALCIYFGLKLMGINLEELTKPSSDPSPSPSG